MFKKVAAQVLGFKLTKQEVESQQTVVKAEIVKYSNLEPPRSAASTQQRSAMCSIQ